MQTRRTANRSAARNTGRKPLLMRANEQYCLDFGQKNIYPIRCKTCGMLYAVGEESDEKQHAKYHAEFDEGVRWSVKLERPKKYLDNGSRVVAISKDDPKQTLDTINKVLKMSDGDMIAGEEVSKLLNKNNTLFLIYITPSNHIVGYIFVELIKEAYELVDYETSKLESEPTRADCGVLYLWVHPSYRRKRIATVLVDVARANLKKESVIYRPRVAVCDPTELAVPFFKAYFHNKRPVKVYQQK